MEIGAKKRSKTIASVFLRYVCLLAGGAVFWLLFLAMAVSLLNVAGEILPANYAEQQLSGAAGDFRKAPEITEEMVPEGCTFGVYGKAGGWRYGTFPGEERESAWEHYEERDIYAAGQGYYRFFARDNGEVCIVKYQIMARFANPFLYKYLPGPEILLIPLYVVLLLVHTALVSRHFGKYMGKRLSVLNEVTGEIRNRNLEFEEMHSELKEVEEVLDSLYQMRDALKNSLYRQWELEKSREEQIAALAHDIRTPLTVIRGNAELLAEGELGEEEREYSRDILQSAAIMEEYLGMLREILMVEEREMGAEKTGSGEWEEILNEDVERAAGKQGAGSGKVRKAAGKQEAGSGNVRRAGEKRMSCDELADTLEEQVRLLATPRQCPVFFDRAKLHGEVWCEEGQIVRAFQNIVGNALDYSPPGKGIRIELCEREKDGKEYLAVQVEDEGPGFTSQDLKFAAERFYRGDKSRSSKVHYGIGLHTARRFVRMQGGELEIENGKRGGARVTLYIRIAH